MVECIRGYFRDRFAEFLSGKEETNTFIREATEERKATE